MKNGFFAIKSYSIAGLTLIAGVVLSLSYGDWDWFARSGSLVVVNGIILTSRQIIEHMHTLGLWARSSAQCSRDWANTERRYLLQDDHRSRWLSEKYGLYMLVLGTLVWGFGDLPGRL
ncbi:MAG: hypothetical protein OQK94_11685 [Gammaproteobacteria bacterium]|nr:hypothetical protein [Gammaproteobacteria bacterium]MCW8841230.1 hypothetical protein [Gammaproteobacteria bacterium]MCW8927740.1 hypothetical protein [Gammaproteobacteria bacterium]MCW8959895.1 hypothetical protein [Gammaproteobacteria bacterium]MCW8971745.1 hypothetical protein [Gammaproteobacteria bacterium]